MTETTPIPLGNVITIDNEGIKNHLDWVVRGTVEETLNALLDAETDRLCNARRYERSEARRDSRWPLRAQSADQGRRGAAQVADSRRLRPPLSSANRRRESSVEALIEMYLAGVSVRRVVDITEALWGTRVSPSTMSDLNKKILRDHRNVAKPPDRRRAPLV
jgi:putative transposase